MQSIINNLVTLIKNKAPLTQGLNSLQQSELIPVNFTISNPSINSTLSINHDTKSLDVNINDNQISNYYLLL